METSTSRPEVTARQQGNLFLIDAAARTDAIAGLNTQRALGCNVEWLEVDQIGQRYAEYQPLGVVGGTLGHDDGSVDPTALLRGYRAKAADLGAEYVESDASALIADDSMMRGLRLASGEEVRCGRVVLTAGAWSAALAAGIGIELPVKPLMRTVYVVSTPFQAEGLPSVFLPGGIYAISESDNVWLMGWSRPEDPEGFDFVPGSRQRFEDLIWPELVAHLPVFEGLQVERSWAGLYAVNTLDGNAILGEWPTTRGLFLATGFSGHGLQQAPAVGRYLAESVLEAPHELDLHRLGGQRILENAPLHEHAGRII
jgi:glycine/D-amino acid oxidase-like deaminating enzyme